VVVKNRSSLGFTLIELMTVVAVLAIFIALAVPSFTDFFARARLRAASDAIVAMLANARVEAVKMDRDVIVSIGGTTAAWCVGANMAVTPAAGTRIPDAAACDCTAANVCLLGDATAVLNGGDFRGVTLGSVGTSIGFDSKLGGLNLSATSGFTEPSVTVNSSDTRYALLVSVSALGHARACVPSGHLPISGYSEC
jgi:prepilin-type N-terminal cleavage/methylation domain-containing protein